MTRAIVTACLLTAALVRGASAGPAVIHLASLQVVDLGGPPMLRLAADGPIAYAVEPDPSGAGSPGGLRLRLYGVQPTAALTQQSGAPFVVQATASGQDTILQVDAPGLASGRLAVGTAGRTTELVIVVR